LTGRWDEVGSPHAGADSKVFNPFRTGGIIVLIRVLPHRSEIVLGVLEVILRRDPVPGQGFGAGQGQIALIVPLSILSVPRLGVGQPGRSVSPGGLGSSRHRVGHHSPIWFVCAIVGLSSETYFIVGPCAAPGGRAAFV